MTSGYFYPDFCILWWEGSCMIMADSIFYNGEIHTMVNETDVCHAMAVYDGKIIATGSTEQICAIKAKKSIDLQGKNVFPGFTDTHQHLAMYAKSLLNVQISGCKSLQELQGKIKKRAAETPPGTWIIGRGFDHELFDPPIMPVREALDAAANDHPVLITRYCGHISVANSLALQLAKVGTHGEAPGTLDHDECGRLNGILRESAATAAITAMIPEVDLNTFKNMLAKACFQHAAVGITSIHTVGVHEHGKEYIGIYQELEEEGRLPIRINVSSDQYLDIGIHTGFGNEKIKLGYYKAFADGSLGSRNAALFEDYSDNPGNKGILNHTQDELNAMCRKAYEQGMQLGIHAIGDKGIDLALNAFAYACAEHPREDSRFRLIHAMCCNERLLKKMKDLKVIVDIQPPFISNTNIDWSIDRLGPGRIQWAYPWKTYINNGLVLTGGSDSPVEIFDPLWGIFSIVNRQAADGHPAGGFQPQERVSVYEALCMYTKNAAYASFEEHVKGTLECGKFADFVILSNNPYTVEPFAIKDIQVEQTYVNGENVYYALAAGNV